MQNKKYSRRQQNQLNIQKELISKYRTALENLEQGQKTQDHYRKLSEIIRKRHREELIESLGRRTIEDNW